MFFKLESLKERAFNAVYEDLLHNLIHFLLLVDEENDDGVSLDSDKDSQAMEEDEHVVDEEPAEENLAKKPKLENVGDAAVKPKQTREEFVNSKREALDEYLIGNYSHYRQKLIDQFSYEYSQQGDDELWILFLDCVLDKSFTELDISPFTVECDPTQLCKIVGNRCSLLNMLELDLENCEVIEKTPALSMTREIEDGICQMMKNLNNMTFLNLSCSCPPTALCMAFFNSLGSSCPQLTHLELKHFPFGTVQLFALMFGSKEELVPNFFRTQARGTVNQLHSLQFNLKSLTPICSSLMTLRNHRPLVGDQKDNYSDEETEGLCILGDSSTFAFILRHFPKLVEFKQTCQHRSPHDDDTMGGRDCCGSSDDGCHAKKYIQHSPVDPIKATELLYVSQNSQTGVTVTNVSSSVMLGRIEWTTNSPFIAGKEIPLVISYLIKTNLFAI